ncbi:MAG: PAS domain S-box protein [Methylomonas sp.]
MITFIPVIATILQLWLLRYIPHTTWLLLYPAVFISAWLAGLQGSAIATVVATVLGIYFFIEPYGQWAISDPRYVYSILVFVLMGLALGLLIEKLERSRYAINDIAARQIKSDQERLALALASSHAGLWEWALADNQVTWTDTLARLYDYDESTPSSYDNWLASVHPQDQGPVVARVMEAVSQGLEFSVEWRVANRPENQPRWLASNGKPVFDDKNKLVCYRGVVLDITQRHQQEQALRDSESEFRSLAEAVPQIVWITTADGWNIFFNQRWVDYTGLSLEQSYGHGWNTPFHPDDRQIAWEAWKNAVHHQATYSLECRLRRYDGEYRWWLIRGVPVKDADGNILKWFGTCTDIHDLKLAQEHLIQSENRYRQLFEANPLPLWIYDPDSLNFLDVNTAAIATYGYSRDEFMAMSLKDIYSPEAIELMQQANDSTSPHQSDKLYQMASAWRHRRKDGSQFWAQLDSHRLLLDGRQAEIVLIRDVSAELEAEHKLQESEARWQFALEGSDQGVWDWDIVNDRVFFSSRWKSMLGYADEEIADRSEEWSTRIHPDDLDRVMVDLRRYFRGETTNYQVEHRVRCRNGEYKWILARGSVVSRDNQGNPTRVIGTNQDISERKLTEQALIESQARLSLFIQYAPAALAMFDPEMRYLAASARWLEDYRLQGQEIIGRCHYDIFPEIGDAWKTVHRRGLAGEVLKADQDCFLRADGKKQWLRWEVRPWLTKDGCVGGIAIFTEDITQQMLTEMERQRWADAFHYCAHGIAIGNPRRNVIEYCNPAFAALLGHASPKELKGYSIRALYAEDAADEISHYLQECDRLGQIRYESAYSRVDGSTLDVQIDLVSVKDGNGNLLYRVATVQDISQRKRDAQTLQLQSSALNAAANAIFIIDPEGVIEWINPAFTRMTGYSAEEAIGCAVCQLVKCNQQNQIHFRDILKSITPGRVWQGETVNRRKDGSLYTVEQTITPVFDEQQCLRHFIAIKQDISVRKQNEQELSLYRHHLEQMVRDRTQELEAARQEAERLSDIKTRFLANMSHEIRTPMHAVLGFCYLLEQRSLDTDSRGLVRNIHNAGNSLLGIINDILDFSKIEAGRLDIEIKPFSLSELLDELASLLMTVANKKNLELIFIPPVSVDGLLGDKPRLQQVLVNLLGNAIKFTDRGEVALHIDVVQLADESEAMRFRVRDTGIGISGDHLAEIFSAFSQADSSISRRFGGTGLGLAICERLVELMGGKLEVTSQEGVGSEFRFQLPLQRADSDYLTQSSLQPMSLLVADDCASAREALSNTINSLGWQADTVDSGDAALHQFMARWHVQRPYDVLLLDWQMPGKDGLETAQEIQSALDSQLGEQNRAPIVIMVTAYDKNLLLAQPGGDRVDCILSKPVTATALYNSIATIVGHRDGAPTPDQLAIGNEIDRSIHGVRVLLVDDSEFNLELALRILQGNGAIVHTAGNGQEALAWLNAHPDSVDIVLMDVQMPVMDGYSATRLIRQDTRWQNLPVVALSAGVLKDEQEKALAAGMNDFVSKPFKVDHFLATIQRLVRRQSFSSHPQTIMPL